MRRGYWRRVGTITMYDRGIILLFFDSRHSYWCFDGYEWSVEVSHFLHPHRSGVDSRLFQNWRFFQIKPFLVHPWSLPLRYVGPNFLLMQLFLCVPMCFCAGIRRCGEFCFWRLVGSRVYLLFCGVVVNFGELL